MIIGVSGNRKVNDEEAVYKAYYSKLQELSVEYLYQGMASGTDLIAALAALDLNISYGCVIPWRGHLPRTAEQDLYQEILDRSEDQIYASNVYEYPGAYVYQVRNEMIVDNSELMLVWNAQEKGGTVNAINYALKIGVPVVNLYEGE